jgi:hypothetical protein
MDDNSKWESLDMAINEHGLDKVMKDPYWASCNRSKNYAKLRREYLDAQKRLQLFVSLQLKK